MSVAVALPIGTVLLSSEVASKVIPAGTVSCGGVIFRTSTIWVAFALLPDSSVAIHVTVVFPNGNILGALFSSETTLTLSETVAFPIGTVLSVRDVAVCLTSEGAVIFGAVVSFIVTV